MKLSNKILLAFFGAIFLYLTAAFTEVRLRGTPNFINEKNSVAETADLTGVSVVVLEDNERNLEITVSENPRLEVRSISGNVLKTINYKVSNDTLALRGVSDDRQRIMITIFVPATGLKGIILSNSAVTVEGLNQEHFYLSQNGGRTTMSDNRIGNVQMDLSNQSYVDINASHLDTLSADIEQSQVLIFSSVGVLKGAMRNESYLRANDVQEIQLKKDKTSALNMNQ